MAVRHRADAMADLVAISRVLAGLAPQISRHIEEPAADDAGVLLPSRPAGDGVVQEDEAVARLKQRLEVLLVLLGRLLEFRWAVLAKANAGHVVAHIGVVAPRLPDVEQRLGRGLLHMGPIHALHAVEEGEKGLPLKGVPFGDEQNLLHGGASRPVQAKCS